MIYTTFANNGLYISGLYGIYIYGLYILFFDFKKSTKKGKYIDMVYLKEIIINVRTTQ